MIQQIKIDRGLQNEEPKSQAVTQDEIDRLEIAKQNMEKKLKDQERQQRKELRNWDKQIKEKEEQFAAL